MLYLIVGEILVEVDVFTEEISEFLEIEFVEVFFVELKLFEFGK